MSKKSLVASKGANFEPFLVPEDTYPATCIGVIYVGTHSFMNRGKRKVIFVYELTGVTHVFDKDKGPEPVTLSKELTVSLHNNSKTRPYLEAWRGKAFTKKEENAFALENCLGVPCMLTVEHYEGNDGKKRARIKKPVGVDMGISQLTPEGKKNLKKPVNPKLYFHCLDFTLEEWNLLADWQKKKIAEAEEWPEVEEMLNALQNAEPSAAEDLTGEADPDHPAF